MSDEPDSSAAQPDRPVRRLDARSLRGLAHPLRMSLLETLTLDGPATATGLAKQHGENTGTVSWHLRQLAQHGYIEEDAERGTRRERWWRAVVDRKILETADFHDDPDTSGALSVYLHHLIDRYFHRVSQYVSEGWEGDWQRAGTLSDWSDLRLTPAQLQELNDELMAVVAKHTPPADAEPAPEALPVVVQIQSFPRKERGNA